MTSCEICPIEGLPKIQATCWLDDGECPHGRPCENEDDKVVEAEE